MATRLRSVTRSGTLATVFSVRTDKELHALMACLCVLFEDLRIELSGVQADDLGTLDECNKSGRKFYFLRRSIATLHEFATAIQELDQLPSFQAIKADFNVVVAKHWVSAVVYFKDHANYIARMRNNVGGHFGRASAKAAIAHLLPDAAGSLEVIFTNRGGGAKLFFANEIVATGALYHVPGSCVSAKSRRLVRHALVAFRKATRAVDCIVYAYLWERFGRG